MYMMRSTKLKNVFGILFFLLSNISVMAQSADMLHIYHEELPEGDFAFYADNSQIVPLFLHLEFETLIGLEANISLPLERVIPAQAQKIELFRLSRLPDANRYSFRYVTNYVRGNPDAQPDPDVLYLFPFEHGTKHQVTQGANGSFTHFGENQYAIDFDLDEGEPIYAARDGLVVEVKQDSSIGGPSARYTGHANFVLIMHEDGTFGNYVHLQQNGALVTVGQQVEAGQRIGLSGNTGRSSGPHLHFDVRVPTREGRMQSIPIRFAGLDGQATEAREGLFFYADHPGKAPFEAVYGRDIQNSDYNGYAAEIAPEVAARAAEDVEMRIEQIDNTYVLFLQNMSDTCLEIETLLQLQGMTATTPLQQTINLPARQEIFLSILRPQPEANRFQYGYQFRFRPCR